MKRQKPTTPKERFHRLELWIRNLTYTMKLLGIAGRSADAASYGQLDEAEIRTEGLRRRHYWEFVGPTQSNRDVLSQAADMYPYSFPRTPVKPPARCECDRSRLMRSAFARFLL